MKRFEKQSIMLSSAVMISGLCLGSFASAAVVVNDRWADASRSDPAAPTYSEDGTDADLDGDIESAWFRSGTGSSTTLTPGHMVNAAGAAGSMSLTTYFSQTQASLAAVGDKLTVTWQFTPTGVSSTSSSNQDMRIAIVDSGARLTSDATPANQVYSGYGMFFNMRAGTLGATNGLRIMEWATAGGANNLLSTAAAWTAQASTTTVVGTTPGFADGTLYTLTWSIEKTATGADINQSIVGGNVNLVTSYSDTSPQPLSFDTFALRPQTPEATATSFDTTLFRVELALVPEPTSLAAGAFGLALLRRRR